MAQKPTSETTQKSENIQYLMDSIAALKQAQEFLAGQLEKMLDRIKALETRPTSLSAELRTARSGHEFFLLPDGKRVNLAQVESYNPYGDHGIVSISKEKQRAQRDAILKMLDDKLTQ